MHSILGLQSINPADGDVVIQASSFSQSNCSRSSWISWTNCH